jgi:hypothetical protein
MSERNDAVRSVLELWRELPEEHRSDFTISFAVIREALGFEWMKRHLDPESPKPGFFRLSADAVTEAQATKHYRTIDLAESLINLKDIEGFPECISRMQRESRIMFSRIACCENAAHQSVEISLCHAARKTWE